MTLTLLWQPLRLKQRKLHKVLLQPVQVTCSPAQLSYPDGFVVNRHVSRCSNSECRPTPSMAEDMLPSPPGVLRRLWGHRGLTCGEQLQTLTSCIER